MKIQEVQRKHEKKSVVMTIRTTATISKWMKANKVSPQLVFDKSVKELQEAKE